LMEESTELPQQKPLAVTCSRRRRTSCAADHIPPNGFFSGKKDFIGPGGPTFRRSSNGTVPRGTLGGAYHRTYPHLHAWYRGWVGRVRAVFAVFAVLSQLLGAAKTKTIWGIWSGVHNLESLSCSLYTPFVILDNH
jgi:hypothetical protein